MKYKRLKRGDVLQQGDQFFDPIDRKWKTTRNIGKVVGPRGGLSYRRPYIEYDLRLVRKKNGELEWRD